MQPALASFCLSLFVVLPFKCHDGSERQIGIELHIAATLSPVVDSSAGKSYQSFQLGREY
jgi:hypothetical protein